MLWALERIDFESVMGRSPSLARALNRQLAERLARTTRLFEQRGPATGRGPAGLRFGPFRVVEQIASSGRQAGS